MDKLSAKEKLMRRLREERISSFSSPKFFLLKLIEKGINYFYTEVDFNSKKIGKNYVKFENVEHNKIITIIIKIENKDKNA